MVDENLENSSAATEGAQTSVSESAPAETNPGADPSGQPVEIESLDRYRYQGRPLKDWESGYMRQQDYTQKTQAIAQERRYSENLSADLDKVKSNPALAEQFRSIYPEKYHSYLRYVLQENSAVQPQYNGQRVQAPQYAQLDPATQAEIRQYKAALQEREVEAINQELTAKFTNLSKKYPFADEEAVVARAQSLWAKMKENDPTNPNLKITDQQWDILWKSQHERAHGLSDAQYKKQVKSQIEANRKGSDVGAGGGLPGQAPRQYKTIKEATNQALADIELGAI